GYNASTAATFSVGAYDDGSTPSTGYVDEVALYPSALTPTQILAHYTAASSPAPGAYSALVRADGARLYLDQHPPAVSIALAGAPASARLAPLPRRRAALGKCRSSLCKLSGCRHCTSPEPPSSSPSASVLSSPQTGDLV